MRRFVLPLLSILFLTTSVNAQNPFPSHEGEILGTADKSEIEPKFLGTVNPSIDADGVNWMKSLNRLETYSHGAEKPIDIIKDSLLQIKLESAVPASHDRPESRVSEPVIGDNFDAHNNINSTPPDNTMAISDGGLIITSDNSTIEFYNTSGTALIGTLISHEEWFDDIDPSINISSGLFDPRALYDPVEDRFIFVILHGSSPATSKVMVCFSQTNDPSGNWNVYELSGNPLNNNCWFDYPNIGISENDLFITGNLFQPVGGGNQFNQSVVFQMDKTSGYQGNTNVPTLVYNNISGGNIGSFTLVPASFGQDGEYGPGIYLVNSNSGSGNRINLHQVTGGVLSNPSLNYVANIFVPSYSAPADAVQPTNSQLLRTNDSRMQHAFYLNGTIHAVHQTNYQSGYSGISYYRIPVANPSNTESSKFGEVGVDNCFPAVASFGLEENDLTVMIGFLSVSSTKFPEMRVVNCDNNMTWSDDVLVRSGLSYIDTWINNSNERWGDYSSMQRKHNAAEPAVWMSGCYGAPNNRWRSWISEIKGEYVPPPVPIADFVADPTEGYQTLYVQFSDSTQNNPTSWDWSFQGANPSFSNAQNPFVGYADTGWFDVTLIASNQFGSDTMVKEDFIHVLSTDTASEPIIPEAIAELEDKVSEMKVYPNPSQVFELTHVVFEVPNWADVNIKVLDMQGRLVRVMYEDRMKPGVHELTFNKLAMSPGTYFVQVAIDGEITQREKVIVQ